MFATLVVLYAMCVVGVLALEACRLAEAKTDVLRSQAESNRAFARARLKDVGLDK